MSLSDDFTDDLIDEEISDALDASDNIEPELGDEIYEDISDDLSEDLPVQQELSEADKKILERYQDLDVADEEEEKEMVKLRGDRRAFSEKLEEDPAFRAKYIADEKKRRAAKLADETENDVADILDRLQGNTLTHDDGIVTAVDGTGLEELDIGNSDLDEELDDIFGNEEKMSFNNPGVVIQTVHNLTININIS